VEALEDCTGRAADICADEEEVGSGTLLKSCSYSAKQAALLVHWVLAVACVFVAAAAAAPCCFD